MKAVTKLQQIALDRAQLALGNQAFFKLGNTVRQALVAEQLLRILAEQDEDVSDSRVRGLLVDSYLWLMSQDDEVGWTPGDD